MANNTNLLQNIPLEGQVCLDRLDSEIRQFEGYREMNSTVNGDVLVPFHKTEKITDKTLAFDDEGNDYELRQGLLYKNGVKVEPEVNLGGSLVEETFDAGSPIVYADDTRIYCEDWYWKKNSQEVFVKKSYNTTEKCVCANKLFYVSFNKINNIYTLRTVENNSSSKTLNIENIDKLNIFVTKFTESNSSRYLYLQISKVGLFRPDGKKLFENFIYNTDSNEFENDFIYHYPEEEDLLFWERVDNDNLKGQLIEKEITNKNYLVEKITPSKYINKKFYSSMPLNKTEYTYLSAYSENGLTYNNTSVFISDDLVYQILPCSDINDSREKIGEDTVYLNNLSVISKMFNTGYKVYGNDPLNDNINIYWSEIGFNGKIYRDGELIGATTQEVLFYDFYIIDNKFVVYDNTSKKEFFILKNSKNILRNVVKKENIIEEKIFNNLIFGYNGVFDIKNNRKLDFDQILNCCCGGAFLGMVDVEILIGSEYVFNKTKYSKSTNQRQWKLFTSSYNPFFNIDDPFFGVQFNPQLIYGNYITPNSFVKDPLSPSSLGLLYNKLGKSESVFYSDPNNNKGESFTANYKKVILNKNTNTFFNIDIDPPAGFYNLPWPQSSDVGLLLPLSYSSIKNIKKTFTGRDYLFTDNKAFELKFSGTTQFFGYDLLAGIDKVEDVFFLQGQPYCISNDAIFSFTVFNSQLQNISPIVSTYGLKYVANNGIIALFFSKFNRTFYAFNGSNQLILVKEANEIIDVTKSDYNTSTKDIVFLADDEKECRSGVWILKDNMSMFNVSPCDEVTDFKLTTKDLITEKKEIIDGVEKTVYNLFSLFGEETNREPIHFKTCFYGSSENRLSKFDCFYFWLFKEQIDTNGVLKARIETITNLTKQTEEKTFNINKNDFDIDGKMLIKWAPQYQSAVGCSLEVISDFPIYSIQVSVTDQGVNTLSRFNG